MKTKTDHKRPIVQKILMVVLFGVVMVLALSSCGKSKNEAPVLSEVAPSPPPPPLPADTEPDSVYRIVEIMPEFPGGTDALLKFLGANTKYPDAAKAKGIQGKVIVQFVVDASGNVGRVKILRGVDPILDEAAMKVVQKLPKFVPGFMLGKNVPVYFNVPIQFSLI